MISFRTACAALLALAVIGPADAAAAHLRWTTAVIDARTTDGCFVVTEQIMKRTGFTDVRYGGPEVTGQRGATRLAVTCIAAREGPIAVLMAIGADDQHVTRARDEVAELLRSFRGDPRDPL